MPFDKYVRQPEPQTKIWRYMDFAKFMSVLDRNALFFTQIKHLDDKSEGRISGIPPSSDLHKEFRQVRDHHPLSWLSYLVVSCWHMSNYEADAMWGRYLTGTQGVAIQSTVERLCQSLDMSTLGRVFTGNVNYFEIEIEPGAEGAALEEHYFHKDPAYSHDQEYRVLAHARNVPLADAQGGLYVGTDLNVLIETVCTAPKSPRWFTLLVASVAKKYGVVGNVMQSRIGRDPLD